MENIISKIVSLLTQCLIAWLFIIKIPIWLKLKGLIATIVKIIGILILLNAILFLI